MLDIIGGCSQPNNLTSTKFSLAWFTRKASKVVFQMLCTFEGWIVTHYDFSVVSML